MKEATLVESFENYEYAFRKRFAASKYFTVLPEIPIPSDPNDFFFNDCDSITEFKIYLSDAVNISINELIFLKDCYGMSDEFRFHLKGLKNYLLQHSGDWLSQDLPKNASGEYIDVFSGELMLSSNPDRKLNMWELGEMFTVIAGKMRVVIENKRLGVLSESYVIDFLFPKIDELIDSENSKVGEVDFSSAVFRDKKSFQLFNYMLAEFSEKKKIRFIHLYYFLIEKRNLICSSHNTYKDFVKKDYGEIISKITKDSHTSFKYQDSILPELTTIYDSFQKLN